MKAVLSSMIASVVAATISVPAMAAIYVSPGGSVTLSGPVTYQVTSPSVAGYSYTCDTTVNAQFITDNFYQIFSINPQSLTVDQTCHDSINGAVIRSQDSSWEGNFYNSGNTVYNALSINNISIATKTGGFGLPRITTCQGTLSGLIWSGSNLSTGAAATKLEIPTSSISGSVGPYQATCTISGTLYVSPFQSFTQH